MEGKPPVGEAEKKTTGWKSCDPKLLDLTLREVFTRSDRAMALMNDQTVLSPDGMNEAMLLNRQLIEVLQPAADMYCDVLCSLGIISALLGKADDGHHFFPTSEQISIALYGQFSPAHARVLSSRALWAQIMDKPDQATSDYMLAAAIFKKAGNTKVAEQHLELARQLARKLMPNAQMEDVD